MARAFSYLLEIQFLGFRFHGWQKQKEHKTVQFMLEQTLNTVIGADVYRTLGASRTDSMVSAEHHLVHLMSDIEIDLDDFTAQMSINLPQDLRLLKTTIVPRKFQIINTPKLKEYHYSFSFGQKTHPFCAPFLTNITGNLDLEIMKEGARVFEGEHNFIQYCFRGNEKKTYQRIIKTCSIERNDFLTGSFFPDEVYVLKVLGEGFLRNQIRIIMGTLFNLGMGKVTIEDIQKSLHPENTETYPIGFVAPASGLILHKVTILD